MTVEDICQNVYFQGNSLSVIKVKRGFAIGAIRDELVRRGIIIQWERDRRNLSVDFTDITATYRALFSSDTIEKDAAILEADLMTCILNFQQYISILKKQKSANVSLPGSIGNEFQNGSHSTSDDTIRLLPATASTTITPNLYDSVIKAAAINAQLSKRNAELESSQSAIKIKVAYIDKAMESQRKARMAVVNEMMVQWDQLSEKTMPTSRGQQLPKNLLMSVYVLFVRNVNVPIADQGSELKVDITGFENLINKANQSQIRAVFKILKIDITNYMLLKELISNKNKRWNFLRSARRTGGVIEEQDDSDENDADNEIQLNDDDDL